MSDERITCPSCGFDDFRVQQYDQPDGGFGECSCDSCRSIRDNYGLLGDGLRGGGGRSDDTRATDSPRPAVEFLVITYPTEMVYDVDVDSYGQPKTLKSLLSRLDMDDWVVVLNPHGERMAINKDRVLSIEEVRE